MLFRSAILRRFGYRRVLIANALLAAVFSGLPALFTETTPALMITAIFFTGGLSRSLQFTSINTVTYADIPPEQLSRATSFSAVGQELSGAVGVSVAALGLEMMMRMDGTTITAVSHFPPVFLLIAGVSALSAAVFFGLAEDAGASLLKVPGVRRKTAIKEASEAQEGHI